MKGDACEHVVEGTIIPCLYCFQLSVHLCSACIPSGDRLSLCARHAVGFLVDP